MSASTVKKSVRIYPKEKLILENDAIMICNQLINNIKHLENQLQYRLDLRNNYLEILFSADDGEHYKNFDFSNFFLWELGGDTYRDSDWIKKVENSENDFEKTALYGFDKIEFIGNQKALIPFYKTNFNPTLGEHIEKRIKKMNKNSFLLNIKGEYTANTESEIGVTQTRIPQEKDEFQLFQEIQSKSGHSYIESIEFDKEKSLLKELFLDKISNEGSIISKENTLEGVNFFYENKKIRSYEWIDDNPSKVDKHRYGYWICRSADWWNNCINSEWIKFSKNKKNR